jgi:uncharacterized protein YukE
MTEEDAETDLRDCEQAVMAAAREERAAHAALQESIKPGDPDWTESNEEAYQARLARWRAASRILVDALNRVGNDGRPQTHATEKPDGRALATSLSAGLQHNRH